MFLLDQIATGRIGFVALLVMLSIAGCATFDHLTRLPAEGQQGPRASDCGTCHVEQYKEWQSTAHARAFINPVFLEAAGNPPENDCLTCHSPLNAHSGKTEVRSFNQRDGVACISCHLDQGAMHGPHAGTALFEPHPAQAEPELYTGSAFCATCHGETYTQWQKAPSQGRKNCQECHMAPVTRRATQGTNVFSNILVSFEKERATRSHAITLENMAHFPGAVTLTAVRQTKTGSPVLEVTVRNNLPHTLPTGTYGEKEIRLVLMVEREGRRLFERTVQVGNEQHVLAAGDSKKVPISLPAKPLPSGTTRLDLERVSTNQPGRTPVVLATISIDSAAEASR